jgi:hypothetical protein
MRRDLNPPFITQLESPFHPMDETHPAPNGKVLGYFEDTP